MCLKFNGCKDDSKFSFLFVVACVLRSWASELPDHPGEGRERALAAGGTALLCLQGEIATGSVWSSGQTRLMSNVKSPSPNWADTHRPGGAVAQQTHSQTLHSGLCKTLSMTLLPLTPKRSKGTRHDSNKEEDVTKGSYFLKIIFFLWKWHTVESLGMFLAEWVLFRFFFVFTSTRLSVFVSFVCFYILLLLLLLQVLLKAWLSFWSLCLCLAHAPYQGIFGWNRGVNNSTSSGEVKRFTVNNNACNISGQRVIPSI